MKVIDKVFIETTYREWNYDLHDFDQLKEYFREQGLTSLTGTIICGENMYKVIENVTLDYINCYKGTKGYKKSTDGYQDVSKGRNVLMKNGLTWYLKRCKDLPQWTMIIIPDKIDLR